MLQPYGRVCKGKLELRQVGSKAKCSPARIASHSFGPNAVPVWLEIGVHIGYYIGDYVGDYVGDHVGDVAWSHFDLYSDINTK